jgi:hypothetical protein
VIDCPSICYRALLFLVSLHCHWFSPSHSVLPSNFSAEFEDKLGMLCANFSHTPHSLNSSLKSMRNQTLIARGARALATKHPCYEELKFEAIKWILTLITTLTFISFKCKYSSWGLNYCKLFFKYHSVQRLWTVNVGICPKLWCSARALEWVSGDTQQRWRYLMQHSFYI